MPDSTTNTPYAQTQTFDYSLPEAPNYSASLPTGGFQNSSNLNYNANNPYTQGTRDYDVYQAYRDYLYRAPDETGFKSWTSSGLTPEQIRQNIASSPEAQTYARARSEINPLIDSQIQQYYNEIGTQRQATQNQLGNLQSQYDTDYGGLTFAQQQQMDAINSLRNQINQDTGYQASQLQERFAPAAQAAYTAANRRGLLDSTISLGLLQDNWKPIQTSLANLYQTAQRQLSDAEQKRMTATQKYNYDVQTLGKKQADQIKQLRDAYALYVKQQQDLAGAAESQRGAKVMARGGELTDSFRQYQLQLQALQEQMRFQQEQSRLSRDQFDYSKSKG